MEHSGAGPAEPPAEGEITPEQEEMLRKMEEEMREVRVEDVLVQSVVSLLNLSARRIAKEDERDLVQAKLGIDAVASLVELVPDEHAGEIRNALSQVQMLYVQQADGGADQGAGGSGGEPAERPPPSPRSQPPGEGPGGLWTPPGVS